MSLVRLDPRGLYGTVYFLFHGPNLHFIYHHGIFVWSGIRTGKKFKRNYFLISSIEGNNPGMAQEPELEPELESNECNTQMTNYIS